MMVATPNIDSWHGVCWYWQLSLRGVLTFVSRGLAFNGYILSYFVGEINKLRYISCTQTAFRCVKVSFCLCFSMERYTYISREMWGVYSLLWYIIYIYIYIYIYIRWLPLCRGVAAANEATCWLCAVTRNAWRRDPSGWAVRDMGTMSSHDLQRSTSALTYARRAVVEAWWDKLSDYVKSSVYIIRIRLFDFCAL